MTVRVAVVISHPIQHFCPQYESWAQLPGIELKVFFAARIGMDSYFDPDFGKDVQWKGLRMDFPHEFLPGSEDRTTSSGIDAEGLDDALAAFGPDLLIVYGYTAPLQRRAARWAGNNTAKLAMISDAELRTPRPLWKKAVKKVLVSPWIRRVDAFLTVGDGNEEYYRAYGATDAQFYRAGFPIDIQAYDPALADRDKRRKAMRERLAIPDDHLVLMTVGKLIDRKRQADMVRLSNSMAGKPVTVILAGSGPDEERLRGLAEREGAGGVIFAGFVQPMDLIDYYLATDVYMHPASIDRHPLSVSEATYCGAPAIVSDAIGSYGPSDDVQPGVNGFVHRLGVVGEMEACVTRLLDPGLFAQMSAASTRIAHATQARAHGAALQALILSMGLGE